jgi:hypothetical protein
MPNKNRVFQVIRKLAHRSCEPAGTVKGKAAVDSSTSHSLDSLKKKNPAPDALDVPDQHVDVAFKHL